MADRSTTPAELAAEFRALIGQFKRRLREQADIGDLTPSQMSAIKRLETEGPLTLSALSRAEGVRPQSMSATIAALQELGHVETAPHPTDRRQTLLSLGADSRRWIAAGRAARQDWLTRAISRDLDAREQRLLGDALALLRRVADG